MVTLSIFPLSYRCLSGVVDKTKSISVRQYGGLELVGEAAGERPGTLHRCGQSLADGAVHLPHPGPGNRG